ncbi:unnamed protein product [Coffea canephora]|uniref:DH200=94 genomic scaffold, scaffold_4676 n=1 Tax=Coffea canephora TaxID=49390 RepID=A0A068VLN1_COFCA|nr:unnamed protein product [Coffea canephora]
MIVGPTKTLFMDEISTGLDSSTTFQIVKCVEQIVHSTEATVLMSLLEPAPETYDLFDDIILLSEGQIQYWADRSKPYRYISVAEFANMFKRFHVGQLLENEFSVPYNKVRSHKAALVFKKYSVPRKELLKVNFDKEWILIKKNSFYTFSGLFVLKAMSNV